MLNARITARERTRTAPVVARSTDRPMSTLVSSETRTCTRCGRHTTFVLDDPAGGWYVCTACGRYA